MDSDRVIRYVKRIKQNLDDIEPKTDRVDIKSLVDIAKENLKEIENEIKK